MEILESLHPAIWIKVITLIIFAFYVVFTLVIYTQIKTMSKIIRIPYSEQMLKTIAVIHIVLAISLFLFALVIL